MSNTNQVCICCEARDNCPHYDTRRTVCVPVQCTDWEHFSTIQDTTDWQHYRIQAAIAAMQGMLSSKETMVSITRQAGKHNISVQTALAELSVGYADALIEELKKGGQDGRD